MIPNRVAVPVEVLPVAVVPWTVTYGAAMVDAVSSDVTVVVVSGGAVEDAVCSTADPAVVMVRLSRPLWLVIFCSG